MMSCVTLESIIRARNLQNACDFDNQQVRKISTGKRLRLRIIHVSQAFGENLLVVTSLLVEKFLLAKLCKWSKKLTLSPFTFTFTSCNIRQLCGQDC